MIPEKLYIPTSTLNFNSIMSTESISPYSFYSKRNFGYKRFERVAPNNLENRTLLYSKFPIFDIENRELENYPMVVEVNTKSLNEDLIKQDNGVFYCDETIYLNPFSSKIYFNTESEKISTLSKAEPSIETKMLPLYLNSITIKGDDIACSNYDSINIKDGSGDIAKYVSNDIRINKLKGLLYTYLLGSQRSLSPEVVKLKSIAKELRNTLSSVIINKYGNPSEIQARKLAELYKSLNELFSSHHLSSIFKEKSNEYGCDFYAMLQNEGLLYNWLDKRGYSKYFIEEFRVPREYRSEASERYLDNLKSRINSIRPQRSTMKGSLSSLPKLQHGNIIEIPEQKPFLTKLYNEYLSEAFNANEFIAGRYDFAKFGGKVFKYELELKENWENSSWRVYINGLLKNLNEYTAFDLKNAKNITLESFAAFCQKGELDIDKLEDYLISNEIGDLRVAFGLWGLVFGFSSIPKTLTKDLFEGQDFDCISDIYINIFKQIHQVELSGKLAVSHNYHRPVSNSTNQGNVVKTIPSNINKPETNDDKTYKITNDVENKIKACGLKGRKLDNIIDAFKKNNQEVNETLFIQISKINGVGKKTIEKIKAALDYVSTEKSVNRSEPKLFEKYQIGKEFYSDSGVWEYIVELLPNDQKIKKRVKIDLDWFQGNYNEKYNDSKKGLVNGYYHKRRKDNVNTLKHFEQYLSKKLENDQSWLVDIYRRVDIKLIINKLKYLYKING